MTQSPRHSDQAEAQTDRSRRVALLRAGVVILVVIGAALALRHPTVQANLQEEKVIALLEQFRSHPLGIPVLVLAFIVLASLGTPVTFLMLTTGAVYGVFPGSLIALGGAVASAVVIYAVAKMIGDDINIDRFDNKLGPMRRKIERQLSRHGIWNLISFRYLPIPWAIASSFLALTGVKFHKFVISSTVALIPTSVAWTYFAQSIVGATEASRAIAVRNIAIGLVALLAISLVPEVLRRINRRRRYRTLMDQRRGPGH